MRRRLVVVKRLFALHPRKEEGVALVMAMVILSVFVVTSATVAISVVNNVTNVETGVLTASATQSASAGVNNAFTTLQADIQNGSSLPCSLTGTVATGSVPQSYSATITYYSSLSSASFPPTASGAIACVSGSVASSSGVAAILVVDVGSAGSSRSSSKETLDSLYSVSSSGGFLTGYGIYDDTGLELNNSMAATTNTGTVFINGPLQCNSATVNGPLYVNDPGDANATTVGNASNIGFSMTNSCTITGALDVNGDTGVNTSSPKIDGNALINGGVSFSNTGPQFQGNVTASGVVAPASSSYVKGTITQNASVTLPTVPTFPVVTWNSSAWTSAGWTVDNYTGTCGSWQNSNQTPTGAYLEFENDATSSTPTVLYTSCALALPQNLVVQLKSNFAVVDTATGGLNFTATTMESSSSTVHDLYLIVPADPTSPTTASVMSLSSCGTNYEIQGTNQEAFGTTSYPINTLIYDPCILAFNNDGAITGQIVGGSFGTSLTNQLNFTYASVGSVPGTSNGQSGLTPVDQYVASAT